MCQGTAPSCRGFSGQIGSTLRSNPMRPKPSSTAREYVAMPLRAGGIGESHAIRGSNR